MPNPVPIIVVGMGERASVYASEALSHPDWFQIVGVADVDSRRIHQAQNMFNIPDRHCFASVEELVSFPRFAVAVINGTMDRLHVPTSLPLLRHGYDILLEKPFATCEEEAELLLRCTRETGQNVMVCHVLRYSPFYRKIKEALTGGEIGDVINIHMAEQVSFFHHSVSYVRGKYASPELCGSGMLLSKCSHDLDIMAWLLNNIHPVSVSSVGSQFQFRPEMAPENSGSHCLLNCPIERNCIYSARRLYVECPQRWANNIWRAYDSQADSDEEKIRILSAPGHPFSRCVYRCNIPIVDHQSLLINFSNGATGTFSMNGGAADSNRHIHITGTRGEISGSFNQQRFTISHIDPKMPQGRHIQTVDVTELQKGNAHGGGDQAIVKDFIAMVKGEKVSICHTTLEDSMIGHRLIFLAEKSRERGGKLQYY